MFNWKKKLVKLLLQGKHDEAQELRNKYIPHSLFRYRQCDDRNIKALEDCTVWMSLPKDFNDAFFDSRTILGPILNWLDKQNEIQVSKPTLFERNKSERIKIQKSFKELKNAGTLSTKLISIVCFTTDVCNQKMWSYYTNHEGFCIEYTFDKYDMKDLRKRNLYPVLYTGNFSIDKWFIPIIKWLIYKSEGIFYFPILAAMHKNPEWKDEKEWRIIRNDDQPGLLPMPLPIGIYLGSRINISNKDKIITIVKRLENLYNTIIPIYEMKHSESGIKPQILSHK